jgi:putative thiamine transport system substrate-binding protein
MTFNLTRRAVLGAAATFPFARLARAADWADIERAAKGQTVYFNAWAGSDTINAYIQWAGDEVLKRYGVALTHVKITDAAETVRRVRDEVATGSSNGSTDLVWINGENFRAMKQGKLLFGPFAESLPNFRYVDVEGKPTVVRDFTEPVAGLESPWGMAQLTFFGDGTKVAKPPRSVVELLGFAKANPGRVSYTAPPDFHGTTFLKQVLVETVDDPAVLAKQASAEEFMAISAPAFKFLDTLHPHLWREGKQFPLAQAQLTQMVADGELIMGITFNPNEPANLVSAGRLPASTIAWQHAKGTIGNTHFVAIPINAKAKEGAQVVANFLLSPEAQLRKSRLDVWGDPTVLAISKLPPDIAHEFANSMAPGSVSLAGPALTEPHASIVPLIEAAWIERYGA